MRQKRIEETTAKQDLSLHASNEIGMGPLGPMSNPSLVSHFYAYNYRCKLLVLIVE